MAFTPTVTNQFKLRQHSGNATDLSTVSIKVGITNSTHTPSVSDTTWSSVSANEVSGTSYTAGGTAISGVTVTLSTNTVQWVHNDITWTQNAAGFSNGRNYVWYNTVTGYIIMYGSEASNFGNVVGDLILDGSASTGTLQIT